MGAKGMPGPLRCKLGLWFHLQQAAFCKMEQIYFTSFGVCFTGEIMSHEHSPVPSPLHPKSNNSNHKGLEHCCM